MVSLKVFRIVFNILKTQIMIDSTSYQCFLPGNVWVSNFATFRKNGCSQIIHWLYVLTRKGPWKEFFFLTEFRYSQWQKSVNLFLIDIIADQCFVWFVWHIDSLCLITMHTGNLCILSIQVRWLPYLHRSYYSFKLYEKFKRVK